MKKLINVDRYYYILISILIVCAVMVIFIIRFSFDALSDSKEVDEEFLQANTPRLNVDNINEAHGLIYNKEIPDLDL